MLILAFETSAKAASVALLENGKLLSFDLDSGGLFRNVYLCWRKDVALTAVERKFVEFVKSQSEVV